MEQDRADHPLHPLHYRHRGFRVPSGLTVQVLFIILLCISSAICYGIVHDQVTARICIEYFTIGHPPVFQTDAPTILALGWGVIATWWVGLILGVPLAMSARLGRRPRKSVASLVRPISILLLVMAGCAFLSGIIGYVLASRNMVWLLEPLASEVPAERHVPFLADLWAHNASYLVGFIGGIVLIVITWTSRARMAADPCRSCDGAADSEA